MKLVAIVLMALSLNVWCQDETRSIYDAAGKAVSGDKASLTALYTQSLSDKNESLRPYLVKAVTLLMLDSSSSVTSKYIQKINKSFPAKRLFKFLEYPPLKVECSACKGYGKNHTDCRKCVDGKCRNCKGEGAIVYGNGKSRTEKECPSCKSTGLCTACSGTHLLPVSCHNCRETGTIFSRKALHEEVVRALKVLLNKAAEELNDESLTVNKKILEEDPEREKQAVKWLEALAKKQGEWEALEKTRISAVKKKEKPKDSRFVMAAQTEEVVETYEEGGSTSTLDHICLEITEYLKAQEKKSKQSILVKAYGQFLSDVPIVHIVLTDEFNNAGYDYRFRAADGFFRFSMLRAQQNGYESIGFKLLNKSGEQVGGFKEDGFWINK